MSRVLFICTGNYYRSRFAEAVFNHHAAARALPWAATSRGLEVQRAEGDLSVLIVDALFARGIPRECTGHTRTPLQLSDLEDAIHRIALDRTEHLPLVQQYFPDWEAQIHFWEVPDADVTAPEEALPAIEAQVLSLLACLTDDSGTRTDRSPSPKD